jgi:hypothetical protein
MGSVGLPVHALVAGAVFDGAAHTSIRWRRLSRWRDRRGAETSWAPRASDETPHRPMCCRENFSETMQGKVLMVKRMKSFPRHLEDIL